MLYELLHAQNNAVFERQDIFSRIVFDTLQPKRVGYVTLSAWAEQLK